MPELVAFAQGLGMRAEWLQDKPSGVHFDVTAKRRTGRWHTGRCHRTQRRIDEHGAACPVPDGRCPQVTTIEDAGSGEEQLTDLAHDAAEQATTRAGSVTACF